MYISRRLPMECSMVEKQGLILNYIFKLNLTVTMVQLNKFYLLLIILMTNCSVTQGNDTLVFNLEELRIGSIDIVRGIDSINGNGYYKYVDKKIIISELGQPDAIQARNDDLMETEILRMKYGLSYVEVFDSSFGEGLNQNEYSLFRVELNDAAVSLIYRGSILQVGREAPNFYEQKDKSGEAVISLRRGSLGQVSDYVLKIQFRGKRISCITAAFD